jgi:hypothetical protein
MRCQQCNALLTDEESVHKDKLGQYTDTCFSCLYGDSPGEDDSLDYDDATFDDEAFDANYPMDR